MLALVAVVAIAATGSTSAGSNATRPPSESLLDTLLDTLFSLGLVAVVAGAVLLLYGLTQRRAIAEEIRSGRYRRTSLVGWLAFLALFAVFAYFRPQNRPFQTQELAGEMTLFGGKRPAPAPPGQDPALGYEPSLTWVPTAVILGLVLTAVIAYFVAERRARRERHPQSGASRRSSPLLWTMPSTTSAARPTHVVPSSRRTRDSSAPWPRAGSHDSLRRPRTSTSHAS